VQVNLYATFRLRAGVKSLNLDLPAGTTVYQAILETVRRVPVLKDDWLDCNNDLHAHVLVFVNSRDVNTLPEGLQTSLQPDDVLDFFPPVAGGTHYLEEPQSRT